MRDAIWSSKFTLLGILGLGLMWWGLEHTAPTVLVGGFFLGWGFYGIWWRS